MTKEVKIGLGVVSTLLVVLGGVITYRVFKADKGDEVAAADGEKSGRKGGGRSKQHVLNFDDEEKSAKDRQDEGAGSRRTSPFDRADRGVSGADERGGRGGYVSSRGDSESTEPAADERASGEDTGWTRHSRTEEPATGERERTRERFVAEEETPDKETAPAEDDADASSRKARRLAVAASEEEAPRPNRLRGGARSEATEEVDTQSISPDFERRGSGKAWDEPESRGRFDDRAADEERSADVERETSATARAGKWRDAAEEESEPDTTSTRRGFAKGELAGAPREPASSRYRVQAKDSFNSIAEKLYGDSAYFKALRELNRDQGVEVDVLAAGDVIETPAIAVLQREYPHLVPKERGAIDDRNFSPAASSRRLASGKTYVAQEGDTIFDIARFELGQASRWNEIYELNRDILGDDFDYLKPGTKLLLPDEAQDDGGALARRRGATRR